MECKEATSARSPRRSWTGLLGLYLTATLPLAVAGAVAGTGAGAFAGTAGGGHGWPVFLPLHVALLAWTTALFRGTVCAPGRPIPPGEPRARATLADWTFPAALPFLYAELPLLMEGLPGPVAFHDPAVAAFESAVFGGQPAFEWAGAAPFAWLSELLHLGYLSYYPLIVVPPALLWLGLSGTGDAARRRESFHRTMLALALAMLPAFAVMVVWPVQGPRYFGPPQGVPEGPVRALVLAVLEAGSSRGAAFPSSHVSLAVAQSLVALRLQTRVGVVATMASAFLAVGAVYGGFHYLTDAAAGVLVGSVAAAVALGVGRGVGDGSHPPPPGEGAGTTRGRETPSGERG